MVDFWHNYATGETDTETPTTDEKAMQYIPQDQNCQGLYKAYRGLGLPIMKALANVLALASGQPAPFKASD